MLPTYSEWITLRITGWQWSAAELPAGVDAVVSGSLFYVLHYYSLFLSLSIMTLIPIAEQGMGISEIN